VLGTIHCTLFYFFIFFNNNSHQNILTFFTFYITSIIFYYYSNNKIHYNTKFFHFFIQILFILYHIITFLLISKLTTHYSVLLCSLPNISLDNPRIIFNNPVMRAEFVSNFPSVSCSFAPVMTTPCEMVDCIRTNSTIFQCISLMLK
jgi:hypothetical protein